MKLTFIKHAKNIIKDAEDFVQYIIDDCVGTGDYQADQVKIDDHFKDDMRVIVAGYVTVVGREVYYDFARKD